MLLINQILLIKKRRIFKIKKIKKIIKYIQNQQPRLYACRCVKPHKQSKDNVIIQEVQLH